MSTSQSNLSNPKFGYDLVVATTQASINATMKEFLDSVTAPVVIVCYVYGNDDALVQIPYATLKANAKGSDPFGVPNGADPNSNQDLINLNAASFAGAFKAQIGLPDMDPAAIPPIVILGGGTDAPVVFNLLCSQFQIVGFNYGPHTTWINQAQPSNAAWYFTSNVKLNGNTVDPNSPVPPAVQQQIQNMLHTVGAGAFSLQQLFVDLDTAILLSTPSIVGVPEGWPVWIMINADFLGQYFSQCQKTGQPVLGYTFTVTQPDPSTLKLGAMSMECDLLLDSSGNPIPNPTSAQQNAATLNYLCTTTKTPPTAVLFPWNWVELGDVGSYSGIQAVRREMFVNYFLAILNLDAAQLCQDTAVSLTHSGDTYYVDYSCGPAGAPTTFQSITPGAAGSDGFTSMASMSFVHSSHDDSEAADHMTSIHGDFNYTLTGDISFKDNLIRITLQLQVYMKFNHHELGINYDDLPGANYYDKTVTIIYPLTVTSAGQLEATPTSSTVDNSAPWNFHAKGILGGLGYESDVQNGLTTFQSNVDSLLDNNLQAYQDQLIRLINNSQSWVFPGGKTFVFNKVGFSDFQDLITHVTYVDPS